MAVFAQGFFPITGGLDQIGDQNRNKGGPSGVPVPRSFFRETDQMPDQSICLVSDQYFN